ncbi:hypothetical protein CKK33_06455 [Mucilaginibacter sp. MD40]|uniref:SIR2 family NAD-dependent protein deacylase n=1 Tax=Mucilaginibacter sp. MD40 TaxID=2029590 RepID=UPI000BACAA30|nr:SIR2 family protein [Mucilaginibacter sp. MD40]PAW93153.1 hypothetical protein CKK33_06455 [Mucilaginibacter sp. MD40]
MTTSHIFKLIRKEEVAVWAGAGMSLYAGYPSGMQLCDILKNELSTKERQQLSQGNSLRAVADDFVAFRNGSRNELNKILLREFTRPASATDNHDLLSRVPHIKNILTTNYDSLIENSYAGRCNILRNDDDLMCATRNLPNIFKVHGDLISVNKVILTSNDYSSFIRLDDRTPFWTSIRNVLANQTLLFMGYGFEDENLWSWLDEIDKVVGQNRKERFLIAPNWSDLKVRKLQQRHVTYVNVTIEEFLNELHSELKLNIASDLENNDVSQDTFNRYVSFYKYDSLIKYANGSPKLTSLYKPDQSVLNQINFTVTQTAAKEFFKFEKGGSRSIKIDKKHLTKLEHFIDEFRMPLNLDNIESLHIVRQPLNKIVSVDFPEDDLSIEEQQVQIYPIAKDRFEAKINVFGFDLTINLSVEKNGINITFSIGFPKKYPPIAQCIRLIRSIQAYLSGKKTVLHVDGGNSIITNPILENDTYLASMLEYYKHLQIIERYFNVSFAGAQADDSPVNQQKATQIVNLIEGKKNVVDIPNGLEVFRGNNEQFGGLQLPSPPYTLAIPVVNRNTELFLGLSLDIGDRSVLISDIDYIDYSEDGKRATLKNKSKKAYMCLSSSLES